MYRQTPITKNHLSHNATDDRHEKLCSILIYSMTSQSFLCVMMASDNFKLIHMMLGCLLFSSYLDVV